MFRMRVGVAVVGAVALLMALGAGKARAADLSSEVPEGTVLYVQGRGLSSLEERFKQTALYAIWREPDVQALLAEPLAELKESIESGEADWPLLWSEVRALLDGPAALALFPFEEEGETEMAAVVVARPFLLEQFRAALAKLEESGQSGRLGELAEGLFGGPSYAGACPANLRQIGLALAIYADDHDSKFPPALRDLLPLYLPDGEWVLRCPQASEGDGYVYVPGLNYDDDPTSIVVFDRQGNHEDGRHVLFLDGHVEFLAEAQFQARVAEQANAETIRKLDTEAGARPAQAKPAEPGPYAIGSAAVTPLTEDPEGAAYLFLDDLFVLGFSRAHLTAYLTWRSAPGRQALTSSASFGEMAAKLSPQESDLAAFFDVQVLLRALKDEMMEDEYEEVGTLGFDGVRWIGLATVCEPPGFRSRIFVSSPGPRRGVMEMIPTAAVSEDILTLAPKMSIAAVAVRVDAADVFDKIRALVVAMGEDVEDFDEALADFREETGFALREGVLAPLGEEFVAYVMSTPLSPFGFDLAVVNRGADVAVLKATLQTFADHLLEDGEEVQTSEVNGGLLATFGMGEYGPPFSPSLGVTDEYAVFSLFPGSARGVMNRVTTGELPAEQSILGTEAYAAVRAKVPGAGVTISYIDTGELVNLGYRAIVQMLTLPGAELPFDPALLPQPEVITQHLKGSLSVLRGDAEGFAIEQYSPILFQLGYSTESFALGSAMMMPAMFRARGAAREAVCKNNLKQIGLAMAIYANDFEDGYPAKLEDLYPNYITEKMLFQCPSDPDPSDDPDYVGYVYVPGFTMADDATTMVLFDKKGNHAEGVEGRNVLFVDGHVEWMTEEAFQELWTKQREEHNHPSLEELGDRVEE